MTSWPCTRGVSSEWDLSRVTCVQVPASHWPCSAAPSSCGTGACALRADAQDAQLHGWLWPYPSKKQERRAGLTHSPHIPCQGPGDTSASDLLGGAGPELVTSGAMSPGLLLTRQVDGCFGTVFPEKEGLCWGWPGAISRVTSWGQRKAISHAKLIGKERKITKIPMT